MKKLFNKPGKELKKIFRDMDKVLLLLTVILFVFGLLNIVSASSRESVVNNQSSIYLYFYKQSAILIAGIIASLFIFKVDTKRYRFISLMAYVIVLGAAAFLLIYGVNFRGSKNWVTVMGFNLQPSEFAKPIIIVSLALLFERFAKPLHNKDINHNDMLGRILFVGLTIPIIVFFQKDLGTAIIMIAIFMIMFLASPVLRIDKLKTIGLLFVMAIIAAIIMQGVKGYILSPEQLDRFNYINPCSNYETGGYQICNGFIAINDGGLFGLGIGKSKQKYSYIPEPHTDSVFAIVIEEYGLIFSSAILGLYVIVLKRILDISSKANTIRGRYICLGVAAYIYMHILINLGGLFGLLPLTGVPLPFLSYGGSFGLSLVVSLAIVQRVHIEYRNQTLKI